MARRPRAGEEAAFSIVFETDARLDPGVTVIGTFPDDSHQRIVNPVARVARRRNPVAADAFKFLTSHQAISIFESYGYITLPLPN
jgi:molybdate transport system substrate-binding protein